MIFGTVYLSVLGVIQLALGTPGGRKYRSLGRVDYNENSFRCQTEGFHPDARDCRTFYRCVDWSSNDFFRDYMEPQLTAFRFECGEGTVFDPDYNTCNHPGSTRRAECRGRSPDGNKDSPGQTGFQGQGGYPGQGQGYPGPGGSPGQGGYPGQGEYSGMEGMPNESENHIMPTKEEGLNQLSGDSSDQCSSPGFFPVKGNCQKFIRCVDNGKGGHTKYDFTCGPGTVWDPVNNVCNYPNQVPHCKGYGESENENPRPGGMPGQGVMPAQGGYPGSGGMPGQGGYPGSGGMPGQGGYPGSGGMPGQGGYPGSGGMPGQGGYPGSGGMPGQGGMPDQGGYPRPGGMPGQGGMPDQGGYPRPGGMPGQEGYPGQGGMPGQGGYPGSGGIPGQGGMPGQGGYPGSGGMPGQGGYPGSGGMPGQGGYPGSGGMPGEGGMPGQGGYPGSGGMPGQGGYPGPGGMPWQGEYPGQSSSPPPDNSNNSETNNPPPGDPSECQSDGMYPVQGNCNKFYRCVNNGNGGFLRYDFQCGEGTVWDQENKVCNHPWAVTRSDANCHMSSTSGAWTQTTSSTSSSSSFSQTSSYHNSSTTTSQNQFNTSSTTQSGSSQSQNQWGTTSGSQTTSNQISNQGSTQTSSSSKPTDQGTTKPMSSQVKPTTENPKPETPSSGEEDPSKPPPGSSPCDQNKIPSQIKCEKAGFYPDPDDCSKFYRCADWDDGKGERFSVYYFECGKGTIWDPALETCNYEKSVYPPRKCGRNSAPGGSSPTPPSSTTPSSSFPTSPSSTMPSTITDIKQTTTTSLPTTTTSRGPDSSTTTSQSVTTIDLSTPATQTSTPDSSTPTELSTATDSQTSTKPSPTQTSTDIRDTTTGTTDNRESTASSFTEPTTEGIDSTTSTPTSPSPSTDSTESTMKTDETSSETNTESITTSAGTTVPTSGLTESTTSSSTSESTEPMESTTSQSSTGAPSDRNPNCPQLNDDQSAFVCPTGFRRHPKDCNLFYQCTTSKDTGDINVMVLSCKNNTVYDERRIQCLPADETDSCQDQKPGRRYSRKVEEDFASVVYVSPYKRLCPKEGSFPYEGDCTRFYKCKKSKGGKIQGYLFQCPENYSFNDVNQKCERSSTLTQCMRSIPEMTLRALKWMKSKVPVEYSNVAFR